MCYFLRCTSSIIPVKSLAHCVLFFLQGSGILKVQKFVPVFQEPNAFVIHFLTIVSPSEGAYF